MGEGGRSQGGLGRCIYNPCQKTGNLRRKPLYMGEFWGRFSGENVLFLRPLRGFLGVFRGANCLPYTRNREGNWGIQAPLNTQNTGENRRKMGSFVNQLTR